MLLLPVQPRELLERVDDIDVSSGATPGAETGAVAAPEEGASVQQYGTSSSEQEPQQQQQHPKHHLRLIGLGLTSVAAALLQPPAGFSPSNIRILNLHANSLVSLEVRLYIHSNGSSSSAT